MVELIYLDNPYRDDRIPKHEFLAIKYENELYPLNCSVNENETFIYGHGYIKVNKKKKIEVPLYSRRINDWGSYLEEYGPYCLYYSLTGSFLGARDCCTYRQQQEFNGILKYGGIEKFCQYARNFNKFKKLQEDVIEYLPEICEVYSRDMYINPSYSICGFLCAPHMDVVLDDGKLEKTYTHIRKHELKKEHPLNREYETRSRTASRLAEEIRKLESLKIYTQQAFMDLYGTKMLYREAKDECWSLFCKIDSEVSRLVADEIKEGLEFPICMKDRITYLFGEEASNCYENCMEIYSE